MSYEAETITEGVTFDFYWYELSRLKDDLRHSAATIEHLIKTIDARDKSQADYVAHLLSKIAALQAENAALRKE